MCVLYTCVDRPSKKKRLRRSRTIRLVEGSNCMHACQTLLLLMDISRTSRSSLQVLNKKPSYISAAVFLSTVWHCRHDCNVYLLHQAHACRSIVCRFTYVLPSIYSSAQKQQEKKYVLYVYSFFFETEPGAACCIKKKKPRKSLFKHIYTKSTSGRKLKVRTPRLRRPHIKRAIII